MKYQLLNSDLKIIKETETFKKMLSHTDTLNDSGRGLYIYNTETKKSVQFV